MIRSNFLFLLFLWNANQSSRKVHAFVVNCRSPSLIVQHVTSQPSPPIRSYGSDDYNGGETSEYDEFYNNFDPSFGGEMTPEDPFADDNGAGRGSYQGGRRSGGGGGHDYERDWNADDSNVDTEKVNFLIAERLTARKTGRFREADAIRDELMQDHGVSIWDREKLWRSGCSNSGSGKKWMSKRDQQRGGNRGKPRGSVNQDFGPNGHDYSLSPDAGPNESNLADQEIHELLAERLQFKLSRNFRSADAIQDTLVSNGVFVHDGNKEWRADGQAFGNTRNDGRPGREPGSRSDRNRPYECSQHSQPTDQSDRIQKMVDERAAAKAVRNFAVADAIRDDLRDNYGIEINDKMRQWSLGGDFGEGPNMGGTRAAGYTQALTSEPTDHVETIQSLVEERGEAKKKRNYDVADDIRDELREDYNVIVDDKLRLWSVGGDFGSSGPRGRPDRNAPYTMAEWSDEPDDTDFIQDLVDRRVEARKSRDFDQADAIREELLEMNVRINDKVRQWAVGEPPNRSSNNMSNDGGGGHQRRGGGNLSPESLAKIESLLEDRGKAKQEKQFGLADRIRDRLMEEFNVRVDDRNFEWHVVTDSYTLAADCTGALDAETESVVIQLINERATAKLKKDYDKADLIRDRLESEFTVTVDDRVKEWRVLRLPSHDSESNLTEVDLSSTETIRTDEEALGEDEEFEDEEEEEEEEYEEVEDEDAVVAELDAIMEDATDSVDLESLTVPKLKDLLREKGLPVSGRKADLIERLESVE